MMACLHLAEPNYRAALDAGSAFCLNAGRDLPGARERGRYMKSTHFRLWTVLAFMCLTGLTPSNSSAQERKAAPAVETAAPTGTYVCFQSATSPFASTNRVPFFTLRLETNGTYRAESGWTQPTQDGDLVVLRPEVSRGAWRWDPDNREFLLEPGDFKIYIKRLPVDKQHSNRLVCGAGLLERQESK
jgi:hypothetical protein